ncbi:hypothetical protein Tco_0064603 [Tanacetum coccineum]
MDYDIMIFGYLVTDVWVHSTSFTSAFWWDTLLIDTTAPSQQELDLLFGPLYDEFFNAGTSSVNKSSSPTDNSKQQDTPPTTNNQYSTEPTTPTTNVHAEENNYNQAKDTQPSGSIHLVADETVYKEWEDRMERVATTASSLEAEQDSGNINRTQFMAILNESLP